jgi:DNA (cytosine-5)-methyltransferase 1
VAAGRAAGLFAGIGGFEAGLATAGWQAELLCELWQPARRVLLERFPGVPLEGDVRDLRSLPAVDLLVAGFPCTDLSQAGRTAGIRGRDSRLVEEVLRLLATSPPPSWLVLENVRNMLVLHRGDAMRHVTRALEDLGWRWAYRVVDSRSVGVPQRRQRVFLVASPTHDPRGVLFADDAGDLDEHTLRDDAYGFYWTEGLRGLGWARDAVPTLKGGSTVAIPSPPAIWVRRAPLDRRIVVPSIEDAEALQGFPRGWTAPVDRPRAEGVRWKLVGNAVTVGVAAWLGRRLAHPGLPLLDERPLPADEPWPTAAWGERGRRVAVHASLFPVRWPYSHLSDVVDLPRARPLSKRAVAGFARRLEEGTLRVAPSAFRRDVAAAAA